MQSRLLDSIDSRIAVHAATLHLSDEQAANAKALAYSAAIAGMFGLTPAQLFESIRPAFERWQAMQRADFIENEVQQ